MIVNFCISICNEKCTSIKTYLIIYINIMASYIFDATKKLNKEMEGKFKKLHEDAITV